MNHLARVLAVVAALAGLVAALAALIRELALASDEDLVWGAPSWWMDLTAEGGGAAAIGAAVAAGLTVLLLVLAARQLTGAEEPPAVRLDAGEGAAVSVAALRRLVARRLADTLPGVTPVRVRLRPDDGLWRVHVIADLPAQDLAGVQAAAARLADAELRQAAGRGVASLELEVRRFAGSTR